MNSGRPIATGFFFTSFSLQTPRLTSAFPLLMTPEEAEARGDIQVWLEQGQWLMILTALDRAGVGLLEAIGLSMHHGFSQSSLSAWMKLCDDQPDFLELLLCQVEH